jgi:hypothetical protein
MQPLPPLPAPPTIPPRNDDPLADAMFDIADALRYPVDSRGRTYDVRFLIPILSFHLARMGAVIDPSRAIIKPRRIPPTGGVFDDAIEYVGIDTPDRVEDELAGVTIDDLDSLTPAARAELLRRLGGQPPQDEQPDLDRRINWHIETSIRFDEEP